MKPSDPNPNGNAPLSPGLERSDYTGWTSIPVIIPPELRQMSHARSHTPFRVADARHTRTQGSPCRPTLGWPTESRWRSAAHNLKQTIARSSHSRRERNEVKVQPSPNVADILSADDERMENSQRRIRILEAMARTLYREWFVHLRIPAEVLTKAGLPPIELVASPLGPIPKDWEVKKLKDVCRLTMGQSPKSEFYNETGDGQPFHQGVADFGDRFPTDRLFRTVEGRIGEPGDILFSVRAPVGRMNIADKTITIGRGPSAIRHNGGHQAFLWEQLRNHFTKDDMMGNGAIFAAVTKDDMQRVEILCPPASLVESAEKHFVPLHGEIGNLTRQIQNLRRRRDLLLSRLLSGQVNLGES